MLGFQFSKKGRWSKRRFCCDLWFPEDQTEPVQVLAYFVRNGLDDSVEATQSLNKLTRKAALDRSKLLAFVGGRVKQWKVHL